MPTGPSFGGIDRESNTLMSGIIHITKVLVATGLLTYFGLVTMGCTPTVRVEAPQEPITINLNIKLDADIRVKLEEQAKQDVAANPDLF